MGTLEALQNPDVPRRSRGNASGGSSVSTCYSTATTDTVLPPLDLLTPDYLTGSRRSSAESERQPPRLLIEHISQLDYPTNIGPPCVFCRTDKCTHTPSTLSALSRGLVRGRDGGRNGAGYMNLPSPNVQAEDGNHEIFKKDQSKPERKVSGEDFDRYSDSENGDEPGPPPSVLNRRKALVPPKVFTDSVPFDDQDQESPKTNYGCGTSEMGTPRHKRRSSIVVIPPMQICPGDLLVYSKVLTHKSNVLGDFEGSTQSLAVTDDPVGRKVKNKWSLMQLFDRSSRTKSESLTGLEEVLSGLLPSEFEDEQLSRYKGMCWADFVAFKDGHLHSSARGSREIPKNLPLADSEDVPNLLAPDISSESKEKTDDRSPPSILARINFDSDISQIDTQIESEESPSGLRLSPLPVSISEKASLIDSDRRELLLPDKKVVTAVKKRKPLKRAKTEMALGRNRAGQLFSIFSDRVLAPDRSPIKPAPIIEDRVSPTPEDHSPIPSPGIMSSEEILDGVERTLEEAFDNVQAAFAKNETKRREAVWDLFQSECAFLYDHLMVLKNVYMEPLKKIQVDGFAMFAEPELLFGNLDELCCVTYAFCKEFINLLEQHHTSGGNLDTTKLLVKLFQKGSKATMMCQAYHRYALNYINALNYLETLRRQLEFNEFEKWCNRDSRCKKLQLTDLLVAPVQHIMKVPLILRDIETRTEETQERAAVREIIEAEEASLRELDDKMKWLKNFERLLEIQRNIFWPPITELDPKIYIPDFLKTAISRQPCERLIVSPRRQIIMEGILHLLDHSKPQEMYVILFDDMVLITRRKKGLHKKKSSLTENWASSCSRNQSSESSMRYIVYKQPLSLDRFFLHDVTPQEISTNKLEAAFVIVNLNRFQQIVAVYTFQAQNEQMKHTWLLRLRDTQEKWRLTLQNTVFRNQHRLSVPTSSPPKPHPLDPRSFN